MPNINTAIHDLSLFSSPPSDCQHQLNKQIITIALDTSRARFSNDSILKILLRNTPIKESLHTTGTIFDFISEWKRITSREIYEWAEKIGKKSPWTGQQINWLSVRNHSLSVVDNINISWCEKQKKTLSHPATRHYSLELWEMKFHDGKCRWIDCERFSWDRRSIAKVLELISRPNNRFYVYEDNYFLDVIHVHLPRRNGIIFETFTVETH